MSSYYEKFPDGKVVCIDEEIPFEIPEGWGWARFGNITFNRDSERIPLSVSERNSLAKIYDYYGASGVIDKVDKPLFTEDLLLIGEDGANLINRSTPIAFIARGKYWVNNHAHVIDCRDLLNTEYLALYINAISLVKYVTGTAQPKMNQEKMNSILVAVPPIDEQRRILRKINKVSHLIDEYSVFQSKLDGLNRDIDSKLKQSILQQAITGHLLPQNLSDEPASVLLKRIKAEKEALVKSGKLKKDKQDSIIFRGDDNKYYEHVGSKELDITDQIPFDIPDSWSWARLAHIANLFTGNSISETEKNQKYTGVSGICYVGTKDVGFDSVIAYENGVKIPDEFRGKFKVAESDSVLLCVEGGSAGRKYGITDRDVCFGNKLCCIAPYGIPSKYIFYYIQSASFYDLFTSSMTGIIGGVSVNSLKNILIPIPPKSEQYRIIENVQSLFNCIK